QVVFGCACFGGLFRLRQDQLQRRLLLEGGGDHHENQQHDQNVDQRNDDDGGRLAAFADRELHGSLFLVVTIKAPQKPVAQRLHLNGQRLHLLVVVTPGDQGRDGNQQAGQCRVQRDGDAVSDDRIVPQTGAAQAAEQ